MDFADKKNGPGLAVIQSPVKCIVISIPILIIIYRGYVRLSLLTCSYKVFVSV